jgi:hypothetical protein
MNVKLLCWYVQGLYKSVEDGYIFTRPSQRGVLKQRAALGQKKQVAKSKLQE